MSKKRSRSCDYDDKRKKQKTEDTIQNCLHNMRNRLFSQLDVFIGSNIHLLMQEKKQLQDCIKSMYTLGHINPKIQIEFTRTLLAIEIMLRKLNEVSEKKTYHLLFPAENEPVDEPVNEPANEPINESVNEPVNEQLVNEQLVNEPANEPANEPVNEQPVNERPVAKPINEQPVNEPANEQPVNEPINEQPVNEPVNEPANEQINESVNEQPVNEPILLDGDVKSKLSTSKFEYCARHQSMERFDSNLMTHIVKYDCSRGDRCEYKGFCNKYHYDVGESCFLPHQCLQNCWNKNCRKSHRYHCIGKIKTYDNVTIKYAVIPVIKNSLAMLTLRDVLSNKIIVHNIEAIIKHNVIIMADYPKSYIIAVKLCDCELRDLNCKKYHMDLQYFVVRKPCTNTWCIKQTSCTFYHKGVTPWLRYKNDELH